VSKLALITPLIAIVVAIGYVEYRMPAETSSAPEERVDLDPIREDLSRILEGQRDLSERLDAVELRPANADRPAPLEPVPDGPRETGVGATSPKPEEITDRAKVAKEFLGRLERETVTEEQISSLWNTLLGSGLEKEAVAAFRAYVKAHPDDADAHYGLGVALSAQLMSGASQTEMATLSGQADLAYSKALELDDHHFAARLSKAISYTFYPAIAGKGPETIRHFQILVDRHGGDSEKEMMEEAYFNLGNEYRKMGNIDKAKEVFKEGLRVFPDSERMTGQMEAMPK